MPTMALSSQSFVTHEELDVKRNVGAPLMASESIAAVEIIAVRQLFTIKGAVTVKNFTTGV
jgi:hypothetical protein